MAAALRRGLGHGGGHGHGGGSPECGGAIDPGRVGRRRGARVVRLGLASVMRGSKATGVGRRRPRTRWSSSVRRRSSDELMRAHERDRERIGEGSAGSSPCCEPHGGILVGRDATSAEIDGGLELGGGAMAAARLV